MSHTDTDRLFVGVYPGGVVYADRAVEAHGDYKDVAVLPYGSLAFEVRDARSPLLAEACAHAATIQARRGELFALSACGEADVAAGLATGQTVRLGGR